jgi:hypothetical protein
MLCLRSRRLAERRGKYVVDYRDNVGVRRWVTCETREQADDVLADKIKESKQAAPALRDRNVTVKEYGAQWLEQLVGQVRPRTLTGYRDVFERYIEPEIWHAAPAQDPPRSRESVAREAGRQGI